MTCKACKREDVGDDCGPTEGRACHCCGIEYLATSEEIEESFSTPQENIDKKGTSNE